MEKSSARTPPASHSRSNRKTARRWDFSLKSYQAVSRMSDLPRDSIQSDQGKTLDGRCKLSMWEDLRIVSL
jgi:hypothetical protein